MFDYLIASFSYIGIVLAMAFSGYLIPLPEDIILLTIGYLAGTGVFSLGLAIPAGIIGGLMADNILYWLSRSGSSYIEKLKRKISPERLLKYEKAMQDHGGKTIFFFRFLPGLRAFMPIIAGILNVKWVKFQIYDFLAICIFVPAMTLLGYFFHNSIGLIIGKVEIARHVIFGLIIILATAILTVAIKKVYFNKNSNPKP